MQIQNLLNPEPVPTMRFRFGTKILIFVPMHIMQAKTNVSSICDSSYCISCMLENPAKLCISLNQIDDKYDLS